MDAGFLDFEFVVDTSSKVHQRYGYMPAIFVNSVTGHVTEI
jgi:hypothetical protein